MKFYLFFFQFFLLLTIGINQEPTQNIRGTVVDSETKFPLVGSKIKVSSITDRIVGAVCDVNGKFTISDVPVGKHILEINSIGYNPQQLSVIVTSGRELLLTIQMEEQSITGDAVVVEGVRQGEVINDMATVSAQSFSVEETNRYAGSRGDPARMMANYAGATGTDDSRNDLVIRGNSPLGVIYRIEGVSIPNPNHFAIAGSTGGPVSILNNKFLGNSDFFMSAFPAEYGNSTAGVFDLRLRNGNDQNHEFTGQFGFLGTEVLFEGPLSKKSRASYLVMGRYSTLTIIDKLGIPYGTDAIPVYGDGAFKFNFPTKKGGQISFWGMGGASSIDILISDQIEPAQDAFGEQDRDQYFGSKMIVGGLTYKKPINKNLYLKSTISYAKQIQYTDHRYILRTLNNENKWEYQAEPFNMMGYIYNIGTTAGYFSFNQKLSTKHILKYGLNIDVYDYELTDSIRTDITDSNAPYYYRWNFKSSTPAFLIQPFIQWKFKMNKRLTLNTGIHSQYFSLSESVSPIEPRIGLKYVTTESSTLTAGIGLHSQTHPLYTYGYMLDGNEEPHNLKMDFSRSIHAVIGYNLKLNKSMQFKSEIYYQYLYNIPVEVNPSAFSLLNQGSGFARFFPDTLVNDGKGRNMGLELTVQKFFDNSFYFMTTATLYDSKYTGSDGIERSTDFNGNYIFNFLAGKEYSVGKSDKNTLAFGVKLTYAGGMRYGNVDLVMTDSLKEIIYLDEGYNENRFNDYFRLDLKANYTLNASRVTHEFGLDLVNVLNTQNILGLTYTPNTANLTSERYQLGRLPIFYYKIDFKIAGNPSSHRN
ncbi:TonB-dependent receptor [Crocinitomix algicola]|uniref:TonB-dependent receptor n=1 Tax=Crocinitomix algicola TaxID=1740263 RepID=UPI00082F129D|nr:TonB-dependent receptor [Crocinitomix algicola]